MSLPFRLEDSQRPRSVFSPLSLLGWFICLVLLATDQWLLGPSLFVFLLGWHFLRWNGEPPVIAAAFTYQWLQVTIALLYLAITGRRIAEMREVNYEPMVLISLAAITLFFGGFCWVSGQYHGRSFPIRPTGQRQLTLNAVALSYVTTVIASFAILRIAWVFSPLTQFLFVLSFARYALLYMLVVRLLSPKPRWALVFLVLGAELAMGFSGYFASFRESLVFAGLAILVSGTARRPGGRIAIVSLVIVAFSAAVAWTAIKPILRKDFSFASSGVERLQKVAEALGPAIENPVVPWGLQVDRMISRMWQLEYPSMALARVPAKVPFENGKILRAAVLNTITPRIFFPDKGTLGSESELVSKYTGARVAGRERNTSMAFGYVAESYVDFGWPLMLVPIFVFGCALGLAERMLRRLIKNPEVMQSVRVVVLWSAMYSFETSWVIMIGTFVSQFFALLAAAMLYERAFRLSLGQSEEVKIPSALMVRPQ